MHLLWAHLWYMQIRSEAGKFDVSVEAPDQVIKLGSSRDMGYCKGTKKVRLASTLLMELTWHWRVCRAQSGELPGGDGTSTGLNASNGREVCSPPPT